MNLNSAIEDFLLACEADGLSKSTMIWYRSLLTAFSQVHTASLKDIHAGDLRRYIVKLREQDYSEDTVSAHIRALHRFWAWCANEYTMPNPMRTIKYPSKPEPKPKAASLEDIAAMYRAAEKTRDKAILVFLLDTGCRAAGLVGLRPDDVDLAEHRAIVTEKGNKTRVVVFTSFTANLLAAWIAERESAETLFYGRSWEPLTPSGLYQLLRRLARRAGVQGRFNPHSLRHTFAREYIRAGGDLATLSKLLGHRDVSTTVAHYTIFTDLELQEKHEKYSPVNKLRESEN